ncbi:VWA domain-containing protein [Methylomonas paludis]|uniref:VWA domain-containing protein n=1 Tax=Methylomonas paludis TaxID=1173101 RepID=A0A975R9G4_9GAMM|nr:VWA domain-containing protein [Methylomonas paludis]QWF71405.1 VWA domain-containing protein [Methylomonas paludis]
MINLYWPWLLLLLPFPLLIRLLLPAQTEEQQAALKVPFLADFGTGENRVVRTYRPWSLWVAALAWCCLVLATTRPQWLGEPLELSVSGRDLMLAVDVSGSMHEQDFIINGSPVDRLTAIKQVAGEFIQRRTGDRLGLILFGTQAYLHVPLTFDRKTVRTLLNEAFIGITEDEPQTSIGDAIGLAVKRLQNQKTDSRVLILLTDGANTAGELTPLKAAELAANHHLKIYTIGIGADEMLVRSLFGARRVNPSADLDEKTLTAIANTSGGRYFRAHNSEELAQIYTILDQLEPVEKDKQYFRPQSELFYWPLTLALILVAGLTLYDLRQS